MTHIEILPEVNSRGRKKYRAVAGRRQSIGNTPGEALDAISHQLPPDDAGTLVVVQNFQPDQFFTAEQQQRLGQLMARWRVARDDDRELAPEEQAELEDLIDAELLGATERTRAMLAGLVK